MLPKSSVAISIKTRIGWSDPEEWEEILALYNAYPVKELIIHPRCGTEIYQGSPHREAFAYAIEHATCPLCYNGDLVSPGDVEVFRKAFANTGNEESEGTEETEPAVMIGRGALMRPSIFRECCGGARFSRRELSDFLAEILVGYEEEMSGEKQVLFKMKELWSFLQVSFPEEEKICKKILKCKHTEEYRMLADEILLRNESLPK